MGWYLTKLQLQTIKNDSLSVDDYDMRLKALANNLGAICEFVSRIDLILYAISSLNHYYSAFVCSITDKKNIVTFKEFYNKLSVFEHCLL